MSKKNINAPFSEEDVCGLRSGEMVYITGTIYTARDAAHKRFIETLDRGEELPVPIKNQVIYYAGPCPAKPDAVVGSCGPTTSGRMDAYSPRLLDLGLSVMIGKGDRSDEVIEAIKRNGAVYLAAIGGAGALIAGCVKEINVVAYEDLGTESVKKMVVENMPLTVVIDSNGNDLYKKHV